MEIGERIKLIRKEKKISADDLAAKIGVSRSTIFRYEKGDIEKVPADVLEGIATALNTTPEYLMGWTNDKDKIIDKTVSILKRLEEPRQKKVYNYAEKQLHEQKNNVVNLFKQDNFKVAETESEYYISNRKHEVKINGLLTAGGGTENFDKFIPIDIEYLERVPNDYDLAFRVKGDSMYPAFENDEVIFVRNTDDYYNGMFAAVEIDGQAYIKKIYIEDNRIRLVSLNDDVDESGDRLYPDFYADEKNDIRLIGKVL